MVKKIDISPTQPYRAETRLSANEAAASADVEKRSVHV